MHRRTVGVRFGFSFFLFHNVCSFAFQFTTLFSVCQFGYGGNPFGYLLFLLQELPKLGENPSEDQLIPLLPWTESLPTYCKLK